MDPSGGPQADEAPVGRFAAIDAEPERAWSVAAVAALATMSRSAFAQRFGEQVGEPPISDVRRWRMCRAADLIETHDMTVAAAGRAVGYDSEVAFSRADERVMGLPPSTGRAGYQKPGSGVA